jgi:hypothetical protein
MGSHCFASYPFDRETTAQDAGISSAAVALDRRTHLRLAQPLAPIEEGLRSIAETTETWIRIAMIQIMTKRLEPKRDFSDRQ